MNAGTIFWKGDDEMTASYPSGVKSFGVDLVNGDYLLIQARSKEFTA